MAWSIALLCGTAAAEVPIVFASRTLPPEPTRTDPLRAIETALSGRLLLRDAAGGIHVLVDGSMPAGIKDVMDPDVSYDGTRIVFAGYSAAERAWRIFEVQAGGGGLRQVTRSDREIDLERYGPAAELFQAYDDVDPCYLPDGRICFVSTRYPGVAPDSRARTTNLYVVGGDGANPHRITTERFGADTPAIDPTTGQIVYSRWWRTAQQAADPTEKPPEPIPPGSPGYGSNGSQDSELVIRGIEDDEFPGVNSWFLSSLDPDGTNLAMFSGFRLDRQLTQAYRPSFLPSGEALALFIPVTPFIGYPRGNGLRLFHRGPSIPEALGGPQEFAPSIIIRADDAPDAPNADGEVVPPDIAVPPVPPVPPVPQVPFVYASAAALADGRILVSASKPGPELPDYGIYLQTGNALPVLIYDNPITSELDAVPLVSRPVPPVLKDGSQKPLEEEAPRTVEEAISQGGSFTFLCENIFANAPVDSAIPHAPPVGHRLAIEFYMEPQRTGTNAADPPILIRKLDIPPTGKIETELPAGVPLFEVLRRADDSVPVGRDGQIFHVGGMNFGRSGEVNRCVGCHAGHSQMEVPLDPTWTNLAPSAVVRTSSTRLMAIDVAADGVALFGDLLQGSNLVDRRTGGINDEWAAVREPISRAQLLWSTKLRAREAIVYGTSKGKGFFGERNQTIRAFIVELTLKGQLVQSIHVTEPAQAAGTAVPLDPRYEFDALAVSIRDQDVEGVYEGDDGAALAEVEVIAQALGEPMLSFIRGDADCNGGIDIADAIIGLSHLFLGAGNLCCQAAADVNTDGAVDITDSIALLGFMFLGAGAPAPPFPACGMVEDNGAVCDANSCR